MSPEVHFWAVERVASDQGVEDRIEARAVRPSARRPLDAFAGEADTLCNSTRGHILRMDAQFDPLDPKPVECPASDESHRARCKAAASRRCSQEI